MKSSILNDVKNALGVPEEEEHFDRDIVMHINTSIFILNQAGVGPKGGYSITNDEDTWEDFLEDKQLHAVKTYIYLSVRELFDPPEGSSAILESIQKNMEELLWRLMIDQDEVKVDD